MAGRAGNGAWPWGVMPGLSLGGAPGGTGPGAMEPGGIPGCELCGGGALGGIPAGAGGRWAGAGAWPRGGGGPGELAPGIGCFGASSALAAAARTAAAAAAAAPGRCGESVPTRAPSAFSTCMADAEPGAVPGCGGAVFGSVPGGSFGARPAGIGALCGGGTTMAPFTSVPGTGARCGGGTTIGPSLSAPPGTGTIGCCSVGLMAAC